MIAGGLGITLSYLLCIGLAIAFGLMVYRENIGKCIRERRKLEDKLHHIRSIIKEFPNRKDYLSEKGDFQDSIFADDVIQWFKRLKEAS